MGPKMMMKMELNESSWLPKMMTKMELNEKTDEKSRVSAFERLKKRKRKTPQKFLCLQLKRLKRWEWTQKTTKNSTSKKWKPELKCTTICLLSEKESNDLTKKWHHRLSIFP